MDAGQYPFLSPKPGYVDEPLLCETDVEIRKFIVSVEGNVKLMEEAMLGVSGTGARMLLCFARRLATYAVRIDAPIQLRFALLAAVLALKAEDYREILMVLGILFDSGKRSGGDPVKLFEDAAQSVPVEGATLLRAFVQRPDLEGILEKMGFQPGHDSAGMFKYESRKKVGEQRVLDALAKLRR